MTRHLHHVTLTSGHVRRSPRSEVGDDVVEMLTPLLEQAFTGEHVPVPGLPGYSMTGGVHGRCCAVTLWASDTSREGPDPHWIPVLTTGVAPHSRCGAYLWRHLHEREDLPYATDPDDVPPEPWCADRIELGALLGKDVLRMTGDWSRCVAWTWIEMREKS